MKCQVTYDSAPPLNCGVRRHERARARFGRRQRSAQCNRVHRHHRAVCRLHSLGAFSRDRTSCAFVAYLGGWHAYRLRCTTCRWRWRRCMAYRILRMHHRLYRLPRVPQTSSVFNQSSGLGLPCTCSLRVAIMVARFRSVVVCGARYVRRSNRLWSHVSARVPPPVSGECEFLRSRRVSQLASHSRLGALFLDNYAFPRSCRHGVFGAGMSSICQAKRNPSAPQSNGDRPVTADKQLQRTVMDKMPMHVGQRDAAEPRR